MRPVTPHRLTLALAFLMAGSGWLSTADAQHRSGVGLEVLVDQTDFNPLSAPSQNNTENTDADVVSADDFVVPVGTRWTVQSVFAAGRYVNLGGKAPDAECAQADIAFWSDAGEEPDEVLFSYDDQAPELDNNGDLSFLIPDTELDAGTYWISIVCEGPTINFDPTDTDGDPIEVRNWEWQRNDNGGNAALNSPAVLRNPGNAFDPFIDEGDDEDLTDFTPFTEITDYLNNGVDLQFILSGSATDVSAPPVADVDPDSLTFTLQPGETATATLTVSNTAVAGSDSLTYSVEAGTCSVEGEDRAAPGLGPLYRLTRSVASGGTSPASTRGGEEDVVEDGSFEATSPSTFTNPFWQATSTNFGTPFCTADVCGVGGGTGPFDGDWWAWFGGAFRFEAGSVEQEVTIPVGNDVLSFYLEIPAGDVPGILNVVIDSDTLFTVTEADTTTYATYTEVTLDVSAYADGGTHTLRFESEEEGAGTMQDPEVTSFFVDLVSISDGSSMGGDGPTLSVAPGSGAIAAGESATVTVTADGGDAEPGTYTCELTLTTNDPSTPTLTVPVTIIIQTVSAEGGPATAAFTLESPYPNPAAGQTTVAFTVAEPAEVRVRVYDAAGRLVATLAEGLRPAGRHEVEWAPSGLAGGVYLVRVDAGSHAETVRAVVVR